MGRGKATAPAQPAEPEAEGDPQVAHETGGIGTEIEQTSELRDEDRQPALREEGDEEDKALTLSREDQQAAIASSMGGGDQYPYIDRTQIPVHERDITMNSPLTEASQAELNPAFTAQAKDGGPTIEDESIGTEPNVDEQMLAAAENSGDEDAVEQVQEQIQAGTEQQMDVEAVNAKAEERAPEGVDAATGAGEGEATAPGAPSGMEPSSDGEQGTAGANEGAEGEEGASQSDTPEPEAEPKNA